MLRQQHDRSVNREPGHLSSPLSPEQLRELIPTETIKSYYPLADDKSILYLPKEFKPLWIPTPSVLYRHAIKYIRDRGITGIDVLRHQMGYCESGEYANRIIVPSYNAENQLNYFVARSFFDNSMKYKNPPISKNVIVFENHINW